MMNWVESFLYIINHFENIFGSNVFLFFVILIALFLKSFILFFLFSRGVKSQKFQLSRILIFLVLIGSIVSDFSWIVTIAKRTVVPDLDYRLLIFISRVAWGFAIVQYQSLALFIGVSSNEKGKITFYQKIFIAISSIFSMFFVLLAFYNFNCFSMADRPALEMRIQTSVMAYMIFYLAFTSIFVSFYKIRSRKLPRILGRQIGLFIKFIIFPLLISDFIQFYPFSIISTTVANYYSVVGVSALLITYATFHCMRKIMGLRFLNLRNHVTAKKRFVFMEDFKNIIDQFSQVTDIKELKLITQYFFQEAFKIPSRRVHLHIRGGNQDQRMDEYGDETKMEGFINQYCSKSEVSRFINKSKVIIADELEFSNFYENNGDQKSIINFMNEMAADIFIPIFEKERIIAYIIVDKHARVDKNEVFYNDVERDQMAVFANYLANVIKHLQSKNINVLIKKEKELREELYLKHQEVSRYKESINLFLANANHGKVGTIFYKNRRFTVGNQFAHDLIPINLNTYSGHPITKRLKQLANHVLEYGSAQFCMIEDSNSNKLAVSGILNLDKNSVIIHAYYPEVSDILRQKLDVIKNPTKFDYLLYLETTESGKLIDELIPGSSESLLNFKIDLLKVALGKKAILLDLPEQDLLATAEILHHISLRDNLHILDVKKPSNDSELAIKLFGISKIFGVKNNDEKPLLEKLDKKGTLFIKNVDNLELETQKYLAEFIKFGFFRQFKSEKKIFSDVRIICSSSIDLKIAVEQGKFDSELFVELKVRTISMPSLMALSEKDLSSITDGFTKQTIKTNELQHIFELTDKEKKKLVSSKPVSFFELKNKIKRILEKKTHQNKIVEEVQLVPSYESDSSDPQVIEAVRLGKHALRDKKIMSMLWDKFKNQNKIANLLGVNRSSVNRRCKEYSLI